MAISTVDAEAKSENLELSTCEFKDVPERKIA
jgi:hypothetical protein